MKYPILYFCILLFLGSLLFSCHSNQSSSDLLERAEALLEIHPDSSLSLLKKIDPNTLHRSDNAHFCLLMTKAMIKNDLPISSDSLINISVEYYKDNSDSISKAETYFYAGRVNLDLKNVKAAMTFFLKALDFIENSNNNKLHYLIYYYLGDLYNNDNQYDLASRMQQKALYFSRLLKDSSYIAYSLRNLAFSYLGNGKNDSSLNYYNQALNILPKSNTKVLISFLNEIGGVYNNAGDYENALKYVDKAISLKPAKTELLYSYVTKAHTYLEMEKYDSAIYYNNKTIYSEDIYTRTASYDRLATAYSSKGDYKKAYDLMRIYNKLRDSIDIQTKDAAILEMQNVYQHGKSLEQVQRLSFDKQEQTIRYYRVSFLFLVMLIVLVGAFLIYRSRNKKELLRKSKLLLEQENRLIKMQQKDCQLREDFFKKLNNIKKIPSLSLVDIKGKEALGDTTAKISLTDNDWKEIVRNIDLAYDHFTDRLVNTYPNLTIQETRLCCLVKIKVARNDLANIFCITPQSVKTTKYRIKKDKMGINDKNMTLDLFLENF
jgi:tetratricopeptide (TPR) repeat protein